MHPVRLGLALSMAMTVACSAYAQPRPGGGGGGGGGGDAQPGGAPAGLITSITAEQIAQLFADAGFQSKVIQNGELKMVQTVFWGADTFGGAIPENCDKGTGQCRAFKIFVNLGKAGVEPKWINSWNGSYLYVRAYTMKNGELIFSWDLPLLTGVTPEYIVTSVKLFKAIVDQSTDFKGD